MTHQGFVEPQVIHKCRHFTNTAAVCFVHGILSALLTICMPTLHSCWINKVRLAAKQMRFVGSQALTGPGMHEMRFIGRIL